MGGLVEMSRSGGRGSDGHTAVGLRLIPLNCIP